LMKWDIRAEAIKMAEANSDGNAELGAGEFNAMTKLETRAFEIKAESKVNGLTLAQINQDSIDACIEVIERDGKAIEADKFTKFQQGDVLVITGTRKAIGQLKGDSVGSEVVLPEEYEVIEENRQLIADNKQLIGRTLGQIKSEANKGTYRGVYVTDYLREGVSIP
ncbi:TrkA C-terminal domain-containing protein, partial [Vibrio breoganii]